MKLTSREKQIFSSVGAFVLLVALLIGFQSRMKQADDPASILSEFEKAWPEYSRTLPVTPVLGATTWQMDGAQFISPDTFLVQFEDGHVGHVAVVRRDHGRFQDLGIFNDSLTFDQEFYGYVVSYFGDRNFAAQTYASNGRGKLIKTSNNIFLQ